MRRTTVMLSVLFVATAIAASGTVTRQLNASLTNEQCIGKPYGTVGCPLRPQSAVSLTCGNGYLEAGEECDFGKLRNGFSSCTTTCTLLFCGDGFLSPITGEECEPPSQETYVLDPATGELTTEVHYTQISCGKICTIPACDRSGNCQGGCKWKFLPACTVSSATVSSSSSNSEHSSLSVVQVSSATSTPIAPVVSTVPLQPSSTPVVVPAAPVQAVCGDGIAQKTEECDLGVRNSDIAPNLCRTNCTLPRCGDGVIDRGEECDETNNKNGSPCTPLYGQSCTFCDQFCKRGTVQGGSCGDGAVQQGEECDNGPRNSNALANACRTNCTFPRCGDGIIDRGEECDKATENGQLCTASYGQFCSYCTVHCQQVTLKGGTCGDGSIQVGEDCDNGPRNGQVCTPLYGQTCTYCGMTCQNVTAQGGKCGDGVVQDGEICDDGLQNGHACVPQYNGSCIYCGVRCEKVTVQGGRCGDGVVQGNEECDFGLRNSNAVPNICRTNCLKPHCGDGVIDAGEECDGGESCDITCHVRVVQPVTPLTIMAMPPTSTQSSSQGMHEAAIETPAFPYSLLGGAVALLGLILVGVYVFQNNVHRVVARVAGERVARSIDNIPLDEIEMPWQRWR